jgi:hypothetical protein
MSSQLKAGARLSIAVAAVCLAGCASTATKSETQSGVDAARTTLTNFANDPNMAWYREHVGKARAVLVSPRIWQVGLIFGGSGGQALVIAKNSSGSGWNGPAFYRIASGSVGLQAGAQASEMVALVMTEKARLPAPDPLVQHALAAQGMGRQRAGARLGLRTRRDRPARQGLLAGGDHRQPGGRLQRRASATDDRSRRTCRPSSRPRSCAACSGGRRTSCTARTAPTRPRSTPTSPPSARAWNLPAHHAESITTMEHNLLTNALVYLAAAVLAVPLAKRLGLGAVLGYLLAGMAIGPWGLGLIREVETILHFSEFGVVLLLFLIGLELEPARLWSMRRPIFGWGTAQVLGVAGVLFGAALLAGVAWQVALVAALGLSLSSTAIALATLGERNLMGTPAGQAGFAILLFQDIAAIPMIALIPVLGVAADAGAGNGGWLGAARLAA